MNRVKGLAYCGLACCVCGENETCGGMHDKVRVLAFAQFIKQYGDKKLMERLECNENAGIVYHYQGQLVGDYDKCETVDKVIAMLEGNQIEIKPITADMLPEYAEVIRKSFATVAKDFGWTRDNAPGHVSFRTDEQLASKETDDYFPFGLFDGEIIIGFVSLTGMVNGSYELNKLSVLPEWRHCGYGKQLLDFCKNTVKELGGNKIALDIIEENTMLKNWYADNGFLHIGTKKFEHLPFTVGYMEWCV